MPRRVTLNNCCERRAQIKRLPFNRLTKKEAKSVMPTLYQVRGKLQQDSIEIPQQKTLDPLLRGDDNLCHNSQKKHPPQSPLLRGD